MSIFDNAEELMSAVSATAKSLGERDLKEMAFILTTTISFLIDHMSPDDEAAFQNYAIVLETLTERQQEIWRKKFRK